MSEAVSVFWHRRDFRVHDNHGLYEALKSNLPTIALFIFDKHILEKLEDKDDARVSFIHDEIEKLAKIYREAGTQLLVYYDTPEEVFQKLFSNYDIQEIHTNRDYEPYATDRDAKIEKLAAKHKAEFKTHKDQVLVESDEALKDDGDPYVVFTPYSKKWWQYIKSNPPKAFSSEDLLKSDNVLKLDHQEIPSLSSMGFTKSDIEIPSTDLDKEVLEHYAEKRDIPSEPGTSRMGVHLRFGTVSIRQLASKALDISSKYVNELAWREFYMSILHHFPRVVNHSFREKYDEIKWRNDEEEFKKWCEGKTGYPIVDAGMRELNNTGYMHNRVRMIVASFLTKHLLIDWRWGEAYFARKLLDFELSSNNGGWQWAAGTGVDAAPYFRVFNPELQQKKFDPKGNYIKKWVPEFGSPSYPAPIVKHKMARQRALDTYKEALQ